MINQKAINQLEEDKMRIDLMNENKPKCDLCQKETAELKDLFGKMACSKCLEEYEEGDDDFHFRTLKHKRGIIWIIKRLF